MVTCCLVVTLTAHMTNFILHVWHSINEVSIPKQWYYRHCCKLPQLKQGRCATSKKMAGPSTVNKDAMLFSNICICKLKATEAYRLVKCHNTACKNGKFFHLVCLGLKRMPNNAKTTWLCGSCKRKNVKNKQAAYHF